MIEKSQLLIKKAITNACNRTVKPVTRFAINPAKPAPYLPAVEADVMHTRNDDGG